MTNWMTTLLALAALGWGFLNHRRARGLETRLENVRNSHFRLADQSRAAIERLEGELRALRLQQRAAQGASLFQPDTTVGEALALDERAGEVLAAFHIGGCSSCAVSPEDTLAQAASANGQEVEAVLTALNHLTHAGGENVQQMLERRPNVQLTL